MRRGATAASDNVKAYLFAVARRRLADHFRAQSRTVDLSVSSVIDLGTGPATQLARRERRRAAPRRARADPARRSDRARAGVLRGPVDARDRERARDRREHGAQPAVARTREAARARRRAAQGVRVVTKYSGSEIGRAPTTRRHAPSPAPPRRLRPLDPRYARARRGPRRPGRRRRARLLRRDRSAQRPGRGRADPRGRRGAVPRRARDRAGLDPRRDLRDGLRRDPRPRSRRPRSAASTSTSSSTGPRSR